MGINRTYSRYTLQALKLMGKQIEIARKEKRVTLAELAERCGITRVTLSKIERGEPTTEIGLVFEAATIVGVKIFEADDLRDLARENDYATNKAVVLPKIIRKSKKVNNDF